MTTRSERPIEHRCYLCGVTRQISVRWEQETGDFGTVLSTWPEFDLEPSCPGLKYVEDDISDLRHPNETELLESRDPEMDFGCNCPFGLYFEGAPDPDQERVLGIQMGRKQGRLEVIGD